MKRPKPRDRALEAGSAHCDLIANVNDDQPPIAFSEVGEWRGHAY